jgi:YHS domain-containing protein
MIRILWLLILTAVLYWAVRGLFTRDKGKNRHGAAGEEMVKDPNCGVYLPRSSAISFLKGREHLYFCSEECREEYKKSTKY